MQAFHIGVLEKHLRGRDVVIPAVIAARVASAALILARLMPDRRLRISPRVVKRAMSRYNAKGKIDRTTYKATIDIAVLVSDLTPDGEP